jgi:hypothetical protein
MAKNPYDPPTVEPPTPARAARRTNRTWFPILAGVLLGMVVWCVLAMLESPSFYRLTVWIFLTLTFSMCQLVNKKPGSP